LVDDTKSTGEKNRVSDYSLMPN